ncbi:MAG: hypothetical protein LBD24_06065 [Spirochaetaceae bacterium]|jgi:hypothetical protein|nr:hypothetical protein [Spirochaetaceae bacterium]
MKQLLAAALLVSAGASGLFGQSRSFDTLFPGLDPAKRARVFSTEGLIVAAKTTTFQILPAPAAGIDLAGPVSRRDPAYLVEALMVIPTGSRNAGFLEIYNALRNIRGLKGRRYHSARRNDDVPLFEDATRIQSAEKTAPVPDPPPSAAAPAEETVYIRLKDVNFGNSYYRADVQATRYGLLYRLSNFRALTYLFIPVIKEGKFIAQLYFEPVAEGVLVYSIAGTDVSDFIASQIHIPSAIQKRLEVIIQWVVEGILQPSPTVP